MLLKGLAMSSEASGLTATLLDPAVSVRRSSTKALYRAVNDGIPITVIRRSHADLANRYV